MKKKQFTKGLTVALPPELYMKVREITDEENISMGEWMRAAAQKFLCEQKCCRCHDGENK